MPSSDSSQNNNSNNRRSIGRDHENRAADYLRSQGFEIIEQNWQAGHKEIDLIARKGNVVAFVEVKASSTDQFGHPAQRVDKKKIAYLTQAAQQYLQEHDLAGFDLRFDLITFDKGKLEHYPSAFDADETD